jgi:hypothetical protein
MTPDAKRPLQLNDQGQLRHFLSLDGLPRELLTKSSTPPTRSSKSAPAR